MAIRLIIWLLFICGFGKKFFLGVVIGIMFVEEGGGEAGNLKLKKMKILFYRSLLLVAV
jgi:hypothetical protein